MSSASDDRASRAAAEATSTAYYQVLGTLFDALDVAPQPRRVVELGCGLGALSIWLAGRTGATGVVEAFDIDPGLVDRATRDAQAARCANVRFAVGDVYDPPVAAESVDVVVCRHLLCVLKDPARAVRSMVSLLKPGGDLVVIEPASEQTAFDPDDKRFTRLSDRLLHAFHVGWQRRQADPKVGLRAPRFFLDAGLERLRAEAIAQAHLLADSRRTEADVLDQLSVEAFELPPPMQQFLRTGGFSPKEQREAHLVAAQRLERFRTDPVAVSRSAYVRLMSTQIITVGRRSRG